MEFAANPDRGIAAEAVGFWSKATNFLLNNFSISEFWQCASPNLEIYKCNTQAFPAFCAARVCARELGSVNQIFSPQTLI